MKTFLAKLSTLLATATISCAGIVEADTTTVTFGVGYRQDDIKWTVKEFDRVSPRVEAKQHFKDMDIFTIGFQLKGNVGCSVYYRGSFDYGWICDGRLREKDVWSISEVDTQTDDVIATDARTISTTTSNKIKGKYVADFDLGVGYPFRVWCEEFQLTPMIGFSWDQQRVRVHDRNKPGDALSDEQEGLVGLGAFSSGGHSKYRTTWWGPWIGVDLAWTSPDCWTVYGEIEYHFSRARRERRTDIGESFLDDYERTRKANGWKFKLGTNYVFCQNWYGDASLVYQDWRSSSHRDELNWKSWGIKLDVGYLW